jgi:exopolysaccharide production protein ExoQ
VTPSKPTPSLAASPVARSIPDARPDKPSLWLWVPYIWLFFASTRTLGSWLARGGTGDADLSGSPMDRLLMTLLIVLGLFALGSRAEQAKRILIHNKWMVILFVYIGLSIIWSNFPAISFRRGIRSMGTLVMVLVVLTESNPLEAVRALLRRLYLVHIPLSVITIKYFRNIGVTYNWSGVEEEWTGLTTDKNSLGQVAMCSGAFWLWQILQDWPKKKLTVSLLLLGMTLWILRGSKNIHSSTAIVGFVISAVVLIGLQYVRKRAARAKRIILAGSLALSVLAPLGYFVFQALDTTPVQMVVQATGRNMTLTDRTYIWTDVLNNAAKSPILGVGIGAFWVGRVGAEMYPLPNWSRVTPSWRPTEGHNGFVDVYVELGAVGVVLLLIVIGVGFAGALTHLESDFQFGSLRLTLLLSIILNNITETSFLKGTHDLWFLFLLVCVNLPRPIGKAPLSRSGTVLGRSINHHEQSSKGDVLVSSPTFRRPYSALALPKVLPSLEGYSLV